MGILVSTQIVSFVDLDVALATTCLNTTQILEFLLFVVFTDSNFRLHTKDPETTLTHIQTRSLYQLGYYSCSSTFTI